MEDHLNEPFFSQVAHMITSRDEMGRSKCGTDRYGYRMPPTKPLSPRRQNGL